MITTLIFDWGDTLMRDYPELPGPMYTWEHVEWIPGAKETLEKVFGHYDMVVATNAGESNTEAMIKALQRVGAERYFQYFYSSKDLGVQKPDPKFFLAICEKLNSKPSNCVMIGNSYEKDIAGAKDAGMKTIYFNEKCSDDHAGKADYIVNRMEEIVDVLEKM